MFPPTKMLAESKGKPAQLFVGGACVGDRWVNSTVEGNSRCSCRYHRNIPMSGEEANRGGSVGTAGSDEGPWVVGKSEVDSHEWRNGLRADAMFVFAVFEGIGEVVVWEKHGVSVDLLDCPL